MNRCGYLTIGVLIAAVSGCGPHFGAKAEYGITFYCPGAGNMDFGDVGIRQGLEAAGYRGQVATFTWTSAPLNPALDQTLRGPAKLRAQLLADYIEQYVAEYPGRPVHLVGLSAGTGIAIWALEGLEDSCRVDNVVLLGSSLYHRYDVSKALRHVKGSIYNYYSPNDPILAGPMKVFGTIDGVYGEDGAGAVGLHPPRGGGRVVNIRWRPEFSKYGYVGGHMDSTSPAFVRAEISKHITGTQPAARRERTLARWEGAGLPAGRGD